jgi:hypothetical protein
MDRGQKVYDAHLNYKRVPVVQTQNVGVFLICALEYLELHLNV